MSERPILFSPAMVLANREGRKSETRRMAWRENKTFTMEQPSEMRLLEADQAGVETLHQEDGRWRFRFPSAFQKIKAGDILWVREGYSFDAAYDGMPPRQVSTLAAVWYAADDAKVGDGVKGKYRAGMFMPRWASRDKLEVLAVRVEPLHAITEAGAAAEGVSEWKPTLTAHQIALRRGATSSDGPIDDYRRLFDHINGPGSWDKNPDVVVISYKRLTK